MLGLLNTIFIINLNSLELLGILGITIIFLSILAFIIMRRKDFLKFYPNGKQIRLKTAQLIENKGKQRLELRNITNIIFEHSAGGDRRFLNIKNKARHQQEISAKLEKVREEERTRIAREIHDELGQQLTAIKMDLSWLLKKSGSEKSEIERITKGLIKLVDETVVKVRRISTNLRPAILDDLGLFPALEWQCESFEKRTKIKCSLNISMNETEFEADFSTTVFRIFQEALTNITRHSGATEVKINLSEKDNVLKLIINDNGSGLSDDELNQNQSLGIVGMRERAMLFGGKLTIYGSQESGTTVSLEIPIPKEEKNENQN
jgi:signal transduction histidine kinase